MKRSKAVLTRALLFLIVFAMTLQGAADSIFADAGYGSFALKKPESRMETIGDPQAAPPEVSAKSASLYSVDLGKQVYGKNENEKMSPYSITKLLTCYLALENLSPDDIVTVSKNATKEYPNGTTLYLDPGEKLTVKDLIYGALLASGNDAAYALGEAVSGSEEAFAQLMNETVAGWGCKDTHFVNANGWKDKDHYTTAHDMCIIAAHCFENETLLNMSGEKKYTIPATNLSGPRVLENYMRASTKKTTGVKGGKTGSWSDDDCSIVLDFSREGLTGIVVLLGATKKSRQKDAIALMEFANAVTPGYLVSDEGDVIDKIWVKHGKHTRALVAVDGKTIAYPASGKSKDIKVEVETIKAEAPLKKGDIIGIYRVYANDKQISEHSVVMAEDVETGWFPSYMYISNKATLIILLVILVLFALMRVSAMRRKARVRRLRERRSKEQREALEKAIREAENGPVVPPEKRE